MNKLVLALMVVCLFASMGWGAEEKKLSRSEEYDLSERCGKQADAFFKMKFRLTNGEAPTPNVEYENKNGKGFTAQHYTNHYNKKLNKCFILTEEVDSYSAGDGADTIHVISNSRLSLDDANEHKTYGEYYGDYKGIRKEGKDPFLFMCYISGYQCKSFNEWEALIKPYMEE